MTRALIAIFSGLIAGLSALFLGLMILSGLYPTPDQVDGQNLEMMNQFIKTLPNNAFIIKALTHIVCCFAAGLVAALVSRPFKYQAGILATLLVLSLVIFRDFRFTYPSIYVVSDLALSAIAGFIGVVIGSTR